MYTGNVHDPERRAHVPPRMRPGGDLPPVVCGRGFEITAAAAQLSNADRRPFDDVAGTWGSRRMPVRIGNLKSEI